ncbi:MAG: NTP transferase domain-containing protein [Solirubrobacterales bacterium]|nr:NTP transferase domain-containing protein [Solirubrobacterales bacterium]
MAGELPPICLLAGGLGSRLGETVRDTPKPLLHVAGEPFLVHQLRLLARHGATRVVLCVGYLGELIERRIGASQFGIDITYSYDGPSPIGTLGAVRKAAPALGHRFLVLYGDTYLRLDYRGVADKWEHSGLPALMTVLRNEGQWDVSNVCFDGTRVSRYDKRAPVPEMSWIDFGLGGLRSETLDLLPDTADDLSDLYHELAARGELFGYEASERFFEIGTPASLAETSEFLARLRGADGARR